MSRGPTANIPFPLTALVGRERELQAIEEGLHSARLVTISGPGGVGKTRLAIEICLRHSVRHSGSAHMVDLVSSPVRREAAAEVARVLGIKLGRDETPLETLCRSLRTRELVILLDNCEHLVYQVADLVEALMTSCPRVRIVATSRQVLDVPGERVWRLEPLGSVDARRLFIERARQRRPQFIADHEAERTIDRLCERVDRLPLAIELAAGRMGAMSPGEILLDLKAGVGSLAGRKTAAAHRRDVRSMVEWSHNLLDEDEREAVMRLAVFVGGFDAMAAAAVVPALSGELLHRLVDKSLVAVGRSDDGSTRYRLLETVREYELSQLKELGGLAQARRAHLAHFASLVPGAGDRDTRDAWPETGALELVARLNPDYENVRAALERAVTNDPEAGIRLYVGAWELFQVQAPADGVRLGEELLAAYGGHDRARVLTLVSVGVLKMMRSDLAESREVQEEARALSISLGDAVLEGWARLFQGIAATLGGQGEQASGLLTEAREIHHRLGVRGGEGRALAALGLIAMQSGDFAQAQDLVERGLATQVEADNLWPQGQCHTYLGMIAEEASADLRRASAHYRKAVDILRPFRDTTLLPAALALQGGVIARRDPQRGLQVLAAASAHYASAGSAFPPVFRHRIQGAVEAARRELHEDADEIWAAAAWLDLDDAVDLAFGIAKQTITQPSGLSRREVQVVRLVAEGLTNKAIAARLHVSVRTVESHVRHALAKVGQENRTQLAGWASTRLQ